jgi:hypothetical protein
VASTLTLYPTHLALHPIPTAFAPSARDEADMSTHYQPPEPASPGAPTRAAACVGAVGDAQELQRQLGALVSTVEPPCLRRTATQIFDALSRLLGYLRAIEDGLRRGGAAPVGAHLIFQLVELKTRELIALVEGGALADQTLPARVRSSLDGVAFALRHESRRVFLETLPAPVGGGASHVSLTRQESARAYGMLLNCFQQAIITFAQAFDDSTDGARLFADVRERREQSLQLYRELLLLREYVLTAEEARDTAAHDTLVERLREFRSESMHLLMYRDWEEFERLAAEVSEACETPAHAPHTLHVFSCYLQTLISQVRHRNALHDAI